MDINKVGVVGGGTMGIGIAQTLAQAGITVTVQDVAQDIITRNLDRAKKGLQGLVEKGRMTQEQVDKTIALIHTTTRLEDVGSGADLVIEAVPEDIALKKDVFAKLDKLCPAHTILASNTSILSPTEIGSVTRRPEKTIGMHWFNPAPIMKLVEVTPGLRTSEETTQAILALAKRAGKTPIRLKESPGGVVSRIQNAMRNAAVDILAEGIASAEDIDTAMKLGSGMPMGPLELIDLVGVDVHVFNSDTLCRQLGTFKYRPHPMLRQMAAGGLLGRKTGRGFHDYTKS